MPGPRRRGRITALQALYEADAVGHDIEGILGRTKEEGAVPENSLAFATELVNGVTSHLERIDKIVQTHAPNWPVNQLSIIDRNILRIAIYELMWLKKTPPKVAVNEAVEMAKAFGSDNSPRFVNGVLGALMAEISA